MDSVIPFPKRQEWANEIIRLLMLDPKKSPYLIKLVEESRQNGDWDQAAKYCRQRLNNPELSDEADYTRGVVYVYLGAYYYMQGKFKLEESIECYQHSEDIFEREAYEHGQGIALLGRGLAYLDDGKEAQALKLFERSYEIFTELSQRYAATRDQKRANLSEKLRRMLERMRDTIFSPSSVHLIPRVGEVMAGKPTHIGMASDSDQAKAIAVKSGATEVVVDGERYKLFSPKNKISKTVKFSPGGAYRALDVRGESMIEANIEKGDIIFVEVVPRPKQGDLVVVRIDEIYGSTTLVKKYRSYKNHVRLESKNPAYPTTTLTKGSDKFEILGKVVAILKRANDV